MVGKNVQIPHFGFGGGACRAVGVGHLPNPEAVVQIDKY